MIPTAFIKPLLLALAIAGIFGAGWYKGYSGQHDKLVTYRAQVKSLGKAQTKATEAANDRVQAAATQATQDIQYATTSISGYYRDHPVVRVRNTCASGSTLPIPTSDTRTVDDTTAADNASAYVSPYDPEEVEQVAARLDGLQKLLIKDGVTVPP